MTATIVPKGQAASFSPVHLLVIVVCAFALGLDVAEISLGSALSAIFAQPPNRVGASALSWLVSAVYVGAVAGAPLGGWLCARLGYRRTLAVLSAWIAVMTLAGAASPGPTFLTFTRLFAGLALGASPPLVVAYIREASPEGRRGLVLVGVCALAYLAAPATIFVLRALTAARPLEIEGWRWLFALGAALGFVVAAGNLLLPEDPDWLRRTTADARPGAPSTVRRRLAYVALIYFLTPWTTVGFPLVTGPALLARGVSLSDTLAYVAAAAAGPALSTLAIGLVVDRLPRRVVMAACALTMLVGIAIFFSASAPTTMAVAAIAVSAVGSTYLTVMTLFGAELFPPADTPFATTLAWAANRLGSVVAPLLLLPLVQGGQANAVVVLTSLSLLAGAALLALAPPPWRG